MNGKEKVMTLKNVKKIFLSEQEATEKVYLCKNKFNLVKFFKTYFFFLS